MAPLVGEEDAATRTLRSPRQPPPAGRHAPRKEKAAPLPAWINPDLERLLVVRTAAGSFSAWTESLVDLPAGALFGRIANVTSVWPPSYSTAQAGRDLHLELNSDLRFVNHSCAPTLEWDMERMEMRVARGRDLKKGDVLSFFYPSTEWSMAQPFDCWCDAGDGRCLGRIEGAAKMDAERLKGYWLNGHIREMLEERAGARAG